MDGVPPELLGAAFKRQRVTGPDDEGVGGSGSAAGAGGGSSSAPGMPAMQVGGSWGAPRPFFAGGPAPQLQMHPYGMPPPPPHGFMPGFAPPPQHQHQQQPQGFGAPPPHFFAPPMGFPRGPPAMMMHPPRPFPQMAQFNVGGMGMGMVGAGAVAVIPPMIPGAGAGTGAGAGGVSALAVAAPGPQTVLVWTREDLSPEELRASTARYAVVVAAANSCTGVDDDDDLEARLSAALG